MRHLLALTAIFLIYGQTASAQGLRAVSPLQGYGCMMLKLTHEQIRSNSVTVPVYNGPSTSSGETGVASVVLIVRTPLNIRNGFAESLFPDGRTVWIGAEWLQPYRSASNPNAHCTPSMMSNGKPGFG